MAEGAAPRSFVDLHCHSSASFDSLAQPEEIVRVAAERGLTHVAITDHERLDGALRARDQAARRGGATVSVIVGEEIRSRESDVIGLFLERVVPRGLSRLETIGRIHEQGGLAGLPHPFDRFRASGLRDLEGSDLEELVEAVDYVEAFNARVPYPAANQRAAEFAVRHEIPGVASSDSHSLVEVGVAYTVLEGRIETPAEMLAAMMKGHIVTGRASWVMRGFTPVAKVIQRLRGNRRLALPPGSER